MPGKTRIAVDIGGIVRELFSIEERKVGDLMIYLKSSRSISTAEGSDHEEVAEHRFSVHVSPRSRGHTIKQTLRTLTGITVTSAFVVPRQLPTTSPAGLILPPQSHFCWPIFMARPPRLDVGHYDSKPKNVDRRIALTPFDPARASIVYMVVASSPDVHTLPSVRRRTSVVTLPFRAFNLHVVYGFSPVPSLPAGDFLTFATSPQLSGSEQPANDREPRLGLLPPAIEGAFFRGLGMLRDRYAKQFLEVETVDPDSGDAATIMWGLAAFCTVKPPRSGEDVRKGMDAYFAEINAMKATFDRLGLKGSGEIPDWLEEKRRDFLRNQASTD